MQFDSGRYRENDGNWRWSEHNTILIQVYGTDMARNWLYKNIIVGITAGNSVCKHVNGISMHKSASNTYAYLILCVPPCCRMILARQLKLQRMQNCYHRIANDHFMFMFFVCVSVDGKKAKFSVGLTVRKKFSNRIALSHILISGMLCHSV